MVVRDMFESETASFWYKSPEVQRGELRPEEIKTEIFLLPAALAGEKDGTFTNTHRLVQWHDKGGGPARRQPLRPVVHLSSGQAPEGTCTPDSSDPRDGGIQNLTWDYPETGPNQDPSAEAVLKEINGYTWPERKQLADPQELQDDGATACGVWIYSGVFPDAQHNQARSRIPDGPDGPGTHLGWAFAWPNNRRILYNRASADPQGNPWSEQKRHVVGCGPKEVVRP
jgi:formate dehydrogenase major subunit